MSLEHQMCANHESPCVTIVFMYTMVMRLLQLKQFYNAKTEVLKICKPN